MENAVTDKMQSVREYVLAQFNNILEGEFNLPKTQSIDNIKTAYISGDTDVQEFIEKKLYDLSDLNALHLNPF